MKNMWKNIPFERKEFACKCGCGFDAVDAELLCLLVSLRREFGRVIISGPNRCVKHNEEVQKSYDDDYIPFSSNSYHTKGMAADVKFPDSDVKEVYDFLVESCEGEYGFILYNNRIHIDVRSKAYRKE